MRLSIRSIGLLFSAALGLGSVAQPAQAQPAYPHKPIRMVVPFGAGSAPDVLARALAQSLSDAMAATVTVENLPGAGGTIGVDRVAKSAPDGYTLVVAGDAACVLSGGHYGVNPPYDTLRDLAPIAQLAVTPNVLVVPSDLPVRSVQELVALVRSQPGKFSYASGGIGLSQHRAGELMNSMAGLDMVHVPSPTNAMADLRAGRVQVLFSNIISALPLASAGQIRALAVTSSTRSPVAPDLPTMGESGLPGFEALAWFGLLAPAGTPPAILQRLETETQKALASAALKERLAAMGALPGAPTAEAFGRVIRDDIRRWAPKAGATRGEQKS